MIRQATEVQFARFFRRHGIEVPASVTEPEAAPENPDSDLDYERLSPNERKALSRLARGKRYDYIVRKTGLDDAMIESICRKLTANTLFHALAMFTHEQHRAKGKARAIRERFNRKVRIMSKTSYCCAYCDLDFLSSPTAFAMMTIDHVKPKSKGGSDCEDNFVAACQACNAVKADARVATVEEGREVVMQRIKKFDGWRQAAMLLRRFNG